MSRHTKSRLARAAYTLAEMLVVMTIMLILVAIALPTIKNTMQEGNTREASRQLNAYFAMAKARALQTGRPCGIMMLCDLPLGISEPGVSASGMPFWPTKLITKLYMAEVPAPYSGSVVGSRGRIVYTNSPTNTTAEFMPLLPGTTIVDTTNEYSIINSLIPNGEAFFVRFDFKGAWYLCQRNDVSGTTHYNYAFLTQAGTTLPQPPGIALLPGTSYGYSYQIVRLPRRIGNPLELPTGTCIDLMYSGIGPTDLPSSTLTYGMYPDPTATSPPPGVYPLRRVTVMFFPDGGIESIYLNDWPFQPSTTSHFLVGRSDKINPTPTAQNTSTAHPTTIAMYDPNLSNLADPQSLWVSVSRSTGNVVTSDNQPPLIDPSSASSSQINLIISGQSQILNPSTLAAQTTYLSYCRLLATNREQAKTE
jgi:prepilin-type N-terminal cleavage/methylation domain-containing protein